MKTYLLPIFLSFLISSPTQDYTTAKLAISKRDFSRAAEWLEKAMKIEPDNPEIPLIMAIEIHAKQQSWEKMMEMFELAMKIDSNRVVEVRGQLHPVKKIVDNYSEYFWANEYNKGIEKINESKKVKSIENFETAIVHFLNSNFFKPNYKNTKLIISHLYNELGTAHWDNGSIHSLKAALVAFENQIKFSDYDSKNADTFFNMGVILKRLGNFENAVLSFEKSLSINRNDFECIVAIASCYEEKGDKIAYNASDDNDSFNDIAIFWYNKAIERISQIEKLKPDNREVYLATIKRLKIKCAKPDPHNLDMMPAILDNKKTSKINSDKIEKEYKNAIKKLDEELKKHNLKQNYN